jgi:Fe-S cluster assembly protein SufD
MSTVITANYKNFVEDLTQKVDFIPTDSFKSIRLEALQTFEKIGFPNLKQENWKYTPTQALLNVNYLETIEEKIYNHPLLADFKFYIIVENGKVNAGKSVLPKGVKIYSSDVFLNESPLESAFEMDIQHPFLLLNHSLFNGGYCIEISKNVVVESPILILQTFTSLQGNFHHYKNIVVADTSSEVQITEVICSIHQHESLINLHTMFEIKNNAKLRFTHINDLGNQCRNIQFTKARLLQNSAFTHDNFQINNFYSRNDIQLFLHESNSEGNLNGIFLGKENQFIDNHTVVEHIAPHCLSNETYKGIVKDAATGVFNGRIHVHRDAQKTNAYQQNKNILLSKQASINTKPELEIYADDVKCSHGSTTGMFDEKAIFYLQSRAIGEQTAKLMLTKAFAADVLSSLTHESVQQYIESKIDCTLSNLS